MAKKRYIYNRGLKKYYPRLEKMKNALYLLIKG